jgi:MFS family permease
LTITIINSSLISWYLFLAHINFQNIFQNFTNQTSWVLIASSLFYFSAVISAIVGSSLSNRFDRKKLLWSWTILAIVTSGLLFFFQGEFYIWIFAPLLGISLGFGFPYCSSLFADNTAIENRGRVGGLIILQTFILLSVARIVQDILGLGLIGVIFLLILLRSAGFLSFFSEGWESRNKSVIKREESNWFLIITNKKYVLYFIPWVMFITTMVITDHILWQTLPTTPEFTLVFEIGYPLHYLGVIIFSIVSGIIGDRYGRKPPIFAGLIMLAFSFAFIGFSTTPEFVFVHLVALGVAYGFVWPIYNAIPGDIANSKLPLPFSMERIYAVIQILPWCIYGIIGSIPQAFGISASSAVLAPILSMILFVSILPILIAPEVLSPLVAEKRRQDKHLKNLESLLKEETRD